MADKPSLLNLDQAQSELQNIQGKMSSQISNFESQTIQQTKNVINEIDKQIKTLQNSVSSQDIMGPLKKQLDETMAMFKQFQEIGNRAIATQKYEVETFTNNVSKMYEAIKKSQEAVQQFNSTSIGNVQQINEFEQSINSLKSSFEGFISTSDIINIEQADLDAIRQRMMNFVSDLNSECSKAFNIADILTQTSQDPNIKSAIVNMLAPLNEAIAQIPDNVMNSFAKIQSDQNGTSNNAIQDLINSLNSFSETIKTEASNRIPVQTPIVFTSESDNKVSNTSDNSDVNVVSKLNEYFDKMFANTNVDKNTTDVSGLINLEDVQNEIQGIQDEMSNQISNFESQTIQQTKNVINDIGTQVQVLQDVLLSQDIVDPLKTQIDETIAMFENFQLVGNNVIASQQSEVAEFTNSVSKIYEAIKKSQEAVQQFNSTSIGNVQQINEFEESITNLYNSFENFISINDIVNIEQTDLDNIRQNIMTFMNNLNDECSKALNIADIVVSTSNDPNIQSTLVNMLSPLNDVINQIPDNVMNSFAKIDSTMANNAIQNLVKSVSNTNIDSNILDDATINKTLAQTQTSTVEEPNKQYNTNTKDDTVDSKINEYINNDSIDISNVLNLDDIGSNIQSNIQSIQDEMSNQISNLESKTIQETKDIISNIDKQIQTLQNNISFDDITDPLKIKLDETIKLFENFKEVGNNVVESQKADVETLTDNVSKIYEAVKKSQEAIQQFNATSIGNVQQINEFEQSINSLKSSFESFVSTSDIINIEQTDLDVVKQQFASFIQDLNDECSKVLNIADIIVNTSNDPNIKSALANMLSPLNDVITQIPDNIINSLTKIDNTTIQDLIKSVSNINVTDILDSNILDTTSKTSVIEEPKITNAENETVDSKINEYVDNNSIDISDFLNLDEIESNIQSIQDEISNQISNLESKTIQETKDIISNIDKQIQTLQNNVSFEDIADPLKVQLDETITLFENFKEIGNNVITSQKTEMATFIDNVSKIYEAIEQSQDAIQQFNSTPFGNIQQINEFEKNVEDLKNSFEDFITANDIVDIEQIDFSTIKQQFASFIQDLNDECSKTLNFADVLAEAGNDPNIRAVLVNMLSPLNEVIAQIPDDIVNVFAGIDTISNNAIQGLVKSVNDISNVYQPDILNSDMIVYDVIPTEESNQQFDIKTDTIPKTITDETNEYSNSRDYSDNSIDSILDMLKFTDIESNIKNIQDKMSDEVSNFEMQSIEQTRAVINDVGKQIQSLQDQLISSNMLIQFSAQFDSIADMFIDFQETGNRVIAEQTREVESFADNIAKIYEAIKQSHEAALQFNETSIGDEKQIKKFEQGIVNVKNSLEDFISTSDIINIKQTDLDVIRQGIMNFMKDLNIECSKSLDITGSIMRSSDDPNVKSALLNMLSPLNEVITQIPDDVINSFAKINTNKSEVAADKDESTLDNDVSTNYIQDLTNSVNSLTDIVGTQKQETPKTEIAIYDKKLAEENSNKRLADNTKAAEDAEKATVDRLSGHFSGIFSSEHYASKVDNNINKMEGDSLKLDLKIDKLIEAFDKYSEVELAKLSKLGIDSNSVSTLKDDAGDLQKLLFNYKMKSDGAGRAIGSYETAGKNYTRDSSTDNLLKLIESEKKVKEEAKNATDALDELMGFANKYFATLDIDTDTLQELPDEMKEVLISMNDIFVVNLQSGRDLLKLYEAFGINIDNIGDNLKKSMKDAKDSISEINEEIESMSAGSSGSKLSNIFSGIGKAISGTAKGVGGYYNLLDKIGVNPGIPTNMNGIYKHIRAGTEWYQKFGQMNYDASLAQLVQGGTIDERQLGMYHNTGKELYRMSYGKITNEDYYSKLTQLLTQVQGHYGEGDNKTQGRHDLESMSKMAVMIEKVYGVDSVNTINTFYKELGMSTEQTNSLLSKLVNTAEMANIPVSQYVKTIGELSLKFRDLGVDVKIAENGMRTLTMEGMSFSTAQGLTSGMGNAINRFTDNPGQMAVFGMLSGQFSDPWEAMWKMSDRWDENGNVKPDATKSIIASIGTQMDYIAKMSGGNEYAQRVMIKRALQDMFSFKEDQASVLTNKYMSGAASGDYTSFEEMFEKYFLQDEEGSNTLESDLTEKITLATNHLDELTKAEAIVSASQQDLADALDNFYNIMLKDMKGSIDTLNGSINELVGKFANSPFGSGLADSLNWLGPLIGGASGLISSLVGGSVLKAGVNKLFGKKPKKLKKSKKNAKTTADKADDAVKSAINNTDDTAKTVANSADDIAKSAINGTNDIAKDVVSNADDVAKTIVNSADDATKTIANSADDVVKTVINSTDDAAKTIAGGADDAIKIMASNADDVTKIAVNGADDAVKVIANGADDAIKIVANGTDDIIKTTAGGVLKTVLGTASKVVTPIATLLSGVFTFNDSKKEGKSNGQALMEAGGSAAGSGLGGWAGASSGASIGSMFGPWGAAIGALIGGFAGGIGGDKLGKGAGGYLYNIFADDDKKAKKTSSTTTLDGLTSGEKLLRDVESTMKSGQTQSSKDLKEQLTVLTTISDETNNTTQNIDSLIGRAESIEKTIKKTTNSLLKVLRTDGVKIKASSLSKLYGRGSSNDSDSGSGSTTFGSNFTTTARDELTNTLNNYKNDKNNNTGSIMNTGSGSSIMNTGSGSNSGTGSSLFGSNFNTTVRDELMNALNNHKNDKNKNNNKNNTGGTRSRTWSPADIAKLTVNDVIHKDLTQKTNLTAQDINNWIASKTKSNSKMRGMGEAFLAASKESGLDPLYLVAHAALETGWGTSNILNKKNNWFGIGAFDSSPYQSAYGFSNLEAGIIEGAKWISKNYTKDGQETLWKMVHDPEGWHNYATDPEWARKIASIMITGAGGSGSYSPSNSPSSDDSTSADDETENTKTFEELVKENTFSSTIFNIGSPEWSNKKASYDVNKYKDYDFGEKSSYVFRDSQAIARKAYLSYNENDVYKSTIQAYDDRRSAYNQNPQFNININVAGENGQYEAMAKEMKTALSNIALQHMGNSARISSANYYRANSQF